MLTCCTATMALASAFAFSRSASLAADSLRHPSDARGSSPRPIAALLDSKELWGSRQCKARSKLDSYL